MRFSEFEEIGIFHILTDEFNARRNTIAITGAILESFHAIEKVIGQVGPTKGWYKHILRGCVGIGKSTTLITLAYLLKKYYTQEIFLVTIDVEKFTHSDEFEIHQWVQHFYSEHKDLIQKCTTLPVEIRDVIKQNSNSHIVFHRFVNYLLHNEHVPVVLLIDNYNAAQRADECLTSIQGEQSKQFSHLIFRTPSWGSMIIAFSCTYDDTPLIKYSFDPMVKFISSTNTEAYMRDLVCPELEQGKFDSIYQLCGGIPRELWLYFDGEPVPYLQNSIHRFMAYIVQILEKARYSSSYNQIMSFCGAVLMYEKPSTIPHVWMNSGIVCVDLNGTVRLCCEAANQALSCCILEKKLFHAIIDVYQSDKDISWKSLELGIILKFRYAMQYSGGVITFCCTDLCGMGSNDLSVQINRLIILSSDKKLQLPTIEKGTMLVLPSRSTMIDFLINDINGFVLGIQVSESCYANHGSHFDKETGEKYKSICRDSATQFNYIYITPNASLMARKNQFYDASVKLVSGTNTAELFHGILGKCTLQLYSEDN